MDIFIVLIYKEKERFSIVNVLQYWFWDSDFSDSVGQGKQAWQLDFTMPLMIINLEL